MRNIFKAFSPKPPTSNERLWRLVFRGLKGDAKLLASGLDAAGRPAAGSWATMLIECEIAALRAWAMCGVLSRGRQADGEALIRAFELQFRAWLQKERTQLLIPYCAFSRATLPNALSSLSEGWRRYDAISGIMPSVPSEMFLDLAALFWGRCVEGYTNKKLDAFLSQGEAQIDQFIPRYISVQIQLANAAA